MIIEITKSNMGNDVSRKPVFWKQGSLRLAGFNGVY